MNSACRYLFCFALSLVLLQAGCREQDPVYLGFIAGLSGRAAGLGTAGRNGFQLAVEQANAQGGIGGRPIVAVIRDTRMDQEISIQVTRELADKPVAAIIGPMLSQSAMAIVPEINRAQLPTISPTVSTNRLTGQDDFFFRVYYTNAQAARLLAERLAKQMGLKSIAAIYDLSNRAYTEDWVRAFGDHLQRHGGHLIAAVPYELRSDTLFQELVDTATEGSPQALLLLANAVDTALICQQIAKKELVLPLFATGWSYSDDLFQFGGKAIEGLTLLQSADLQDESPGMQAFAKAYNERFKESPRFQAMHAYDATRIAIETLRETDDPNEIRQRLINRKFAGVQGDLSFDTYGDLLSPRIFLSRIENKQFRSIH